MSTEALEDVLCERDGEFATISINRPKVHNALSPSVMEGLNYRFDELEKDKDNLRAVFVRATGKTFCAGGDLKHMRSTGNFSYEQNKAEAMNLSGVFARIRNFPRPVVGLVNGPAYGGGVGVISSFDMAFATRGTLVSRFLNYNQSHTLEHKNRYQVQTFRSDVGCDTGYDLTFCNFQNR